MPISSGQSSKRTDQRRRLFRISLILFVYLISFAASLAGSALFFALIARFRSSGLVYVPLLGLILGAVVGGVTQLIAFRTDLLQVLNSWLFADYSLVASLVVVSAGRVPFLGLVVPNLVSWKISDNVRAVLPLTAIGGAALLITLDLFSRLILMPFEVPVGLTMGIVGSVLFLYVLRRRGSHA